MIVLLLRESCFVNISIFIVLCAHDCSYDFVLLLHSSARDSLMVQTIPSMKLQVSTALPSYVKSTPKHFS